MSWTIFETDRWKVNVLGIDADYRIVMSVIFKPEGQRVKARFPIWPSSLDDSIIFDRPLYVEGKAVEMLRLKPEQINELTSEGERLYREWKERGMNWEELYS